MARKLSWKDTAESFHTSWDKVRDAVEYVVGWGLEHRTLPNSTELAEKKFEKLLKKTMEAPPPGYELKPKLVPVTPGGQNERRT